MSGILLSHRVFGALYIEDPAEHLTTDQLNEYLELRGHLHEFEVNEGWF